MNTFIPLYEKFHRSLQWVSRVYAKDPYSPTTQRHVKAYEEKVVKPLEEAWSKLSQKDKESIHLKGVKNAVT